MCKPEQRLVDILLVAEMMPLQFDVETLLENVVQPGEISCPCPLFYAVDE